MRCKLFIPQSQSQGYRYSMRRWVEYYPDPKGILIVSFVWRGRAGRSSKIPFLSTLDLRPFHGLAVHDDSHLVFPRHPR